MRKFVLIGVLCAALPQMVTAQAMKVITFNIRLATDSDQNNKWSLRKSAAIDFVSYEEPDFVGMQEVLLEQMNDLENGLDQYKWLGVGRDDGKTAGEFSPIFYLKDQWKLIASGTFWLSETPEQPTKSWDAALPRICTWGRFKDRNTKEEVCVFNTHFDHVGKVARANSASLISAKIQEIAKDAPAVLLGDFNAEPDAQPIQNILAGSLVDAFSIASRRFGQIGTFNGFNQQKIPSRRIDYVFISDHFQVLKYGVDSRVIDGRYLSDHFPIVVQLIQK